MAAPSDQATGKATTAFNAGAQLPVRSIRPATAKRIESMKGPVLEITLALYLPTMTKIVPRTAKAMAEDPTETAPAHHDDEPIGNLPFSTPLIGSVRLTPAKAVTARNTAAM